MDEIATCPVANKLLATFETMTSTEVLDWFRREGREGRPCPNFHMGVKTVDGTVGIVYAVIAYVNGRDSTITPPTE